MLWNFFKEILFWIFLRNLKFKTFLWGLMSDVFYAFDAISTDVLEKSFWAVEN
jgi:hypothetical protein